LSASKEMRLGCGEGEREISEGSRCGAQRFQGARLNGNALRGVGEKDEMLM
jgi:hypothetical protein